MMSARANLKCPRTALAAARPTTGPSNAETTGTTAIASILFPRPAMPGIYVAPKVKSERSMCKILSSIIQGIITYMLQHFPHHWTHLKAESTDHESLSGLL
jgi:hypothetical protein